MVQLGNNYHSVLSLHARGQRAGRQGAQHTVNFFSTDGHKNGKLDRAPACLGAIVSPGEVPTACACVS